MTELAAECDVLVVGAGAAGLSAAYEAAAEGNRVVVIDANARPGGQYHRRGVKDPPYFPAGTTDAQRWANIEMHMGWQAYAADLDGDLVVVRLRGDERHRNDLHAVSTRVLIVATGAVDRQLAIPGWQRPGVMAGGGAQSLIKGSGVLPGRRTLVTGTGPFLLAVTAAIVQAGGEVAAVIEANQPRRLIRHAAQLMPSGLMKSGEALKFAAILARHRIPYLTGHRVTEIHGTADDAAVASAVVHRVNEQWRPIEGSARTFEVDCVTLGFGFTAQLDLLMQLDCEAVQSADGGLAVCIDDNQMTSVPRVLAAGETTGVGGVDLAAVEGRIAGIQACHLLRTDGQRTQPDSKVMTSLYRRRGHLRRFAKALALSFPTPTAWVAEQAGDTMVCRCEEVSLTTVLEARDDLGATDARAIKLLTRAGMGWCQGRMCSYTVEGLCTGPTSVASQKAAANRPIGVPIPLGAVAKQGRA